MCCNQELFQQQEYRLRTELYAKDILNRKFKNVDYWTYTASTDGKYHVNKKLHKIEVPTDDSLNGTYEKTYQTFKLLEQLNLDYDYILRTNCSTYINVNLLKSFVNRLTDERIIYSNNVYCTNCDYRIHYSVLHILFWNFDFFAGWCMEIPSWSNSFGFGSSNDLCMHRKNKRDKER